MDRVDNVDLEVQKVCKKFGGITALTDVTMRVDTGEIVGLIGPNGSGKTTLLNVINGVYRVSSGAIRYQGGTIHNRAPNWLLRHGIARTFQSPRVFRSLTVADNMALPTIETGQVDRDMVDQILETVNLLQFRDIPASQLSGGQQKLLEYARALVTRPKLILMDEPFGGVHPAIKQDMQRAIRQSSQQDGVTYMIVSHEIPDLLQLSHRIACLAEGTIIALGTSSEVTTNEQVISAYLGRRYEQRA